MERIVKRMSEFRNSDTCAKAREFEDLRFESEKNIYFENAVIVKDIMKMCLTKEADISEIADLVDQGIGGNFETAETGDARKKQLTKCIERAVRGEKRTPKFYPEKIIEIEDYDVKVKPDVVFEDGNSIELVLYKAGKPAVKQSDTGKNTVYKEKPLYLLLQYGKTLVDEGDTKKIIASYYYMKKTTDSKKSTWDGDFFSGEGGNIVSLEETYSNTDVARNLPSELDRKFKEQFEEYTIGHECSGDECKGCFLNANCNYVKAPDLQEKKEVKKRAKIQLSDAQQKVVSFNNGVCRVNAGAGAGKTECVSENYKEKIMAGVKVDEILMITFTDAGANEMKDRVAGKLLAEGIAVSPSDINAMTFNTFAYNIVRDKFSDVGFHKAPAVIDDVRQAVIVTQLLDETKVSGLDYLNYKMNQPTCRGALACAIKTFDLIKSKQIDLDAVDAFDKLKDFLQENGYYRFMSDQSIDELIDMYRDYDERLKEDALITFADQEPLAFKILEIYPDYLEQFGFKHIIVDEFQDSNDIQLNMIRKLTDVSTFESLMVVGDDSQSIFGFRDTSPENMIHFYEKLGKNGTDLFLVENHRSVPEILELANKVNDLNKEKIDKDLVAARPSEEKKPIVRGFFQKEEEYKYITENVKKLIDQGYEPEDIAFIAATKKELVTMGAYLSDAGIPWVMMNPMPLMENSRVVAALSLAQAFYQPEATELYFNYLVAKYDGEILNLLTTEEIMNEVEDMKQEFRNIDLKEIGYQRIIFHEYLDVIRGTDEVYAYFLDLLYQNEDLQSELEYTQNFKKFGEGCAKKMEQSYKGVVLTTAHSSKGLEWKAVFNSITDYDGKSLHGRTRKKDSQIEEKRRLLFVSLTRARDLLWVTGQYVAYGSRDDRTYNQFLKELYDLTGQEYNPIDPMEAVREAERKERAKERAKERREKAAEEKLKAEIAKSKTKGDKSTTAKSHTAPKKAWKRAN